MSSPFTVGFDCGLIRWIGFDAVGTLVRPEPAVADIYSRVAASHGWSLPRALIAQRFSAAFSRLDRDTSLACGCLESDNPLHTCEVREKLRWQSIVEDVLPLADHASSPFGKGRSVAERENAFAELFAHFGRPSAWRCFPDVEKTLSRLCKAGFRLAVCSNFDRRLHAVIDGHAALSSIELRAVSSELGYRKPSPRFFGGLLRQAQCDPSELLFVGDDWQNDVEAARRIGIPALLVDRTTTTSEHSVLQSLEQLPSLLSR